MLNNKFKEILEDFIILENCSKRELDKRIDISSSQIIRYLQGVLPEFESAIKIANYFGCSLNYLFGLEDKKEKLNKKLKLDSYNFINKYNKLLKDNNITHYALSKKIDICETSLRIWKQHKLPTTSAVIEIANYFCVSVDYLICE